MGKKSTGKTAELRGKFLSALGFNHRRLLQCHDESRDDENRENSMNVVRGI